MAKKIQGKCSICGTYGVLTYEHIPPKSAFNSKPKLVQGHEEVFVSTSHKYGKNRRANQGFGRHCLCASCNNNTGNWYAKDYAEFAEQCMNNFRELKDLYRVNELKFQIKPLNVMKQIVAMFMCANGNVLTDDLGLRKFVLDRECKDLPEQYRVHIFTTISKNCRYNGLSTILQANGSIINMSEIVHRPFGFQLTVNSNPTERMADITEFTKADYDTIYTMTLTTAMLDVIGALPGNGMSES
ncbi:hypothetical protein [Fluviicola sp.]|uniref:hypothetical protein n=1 Tax=Fluviicola sp. TaxID=1917219 RepID=UPI0031E44A69